MATIQFFKGTDEDVTPDVRLTRSRDGKQSTATFYFQNPSVLNGNSADGITGMYMIDEEGEIITREVKGKFVNGKPEALEVFYIMNSTSEWDRFLRFTERYAEKNELGFNKA